MSHSIAYDRWTFPARRIKTGNIHLATSLLSSSLEVNSFTAIVECDAPSILDFKRNAKLIYYSKAGRGTVWRVQNIERIAPKLYKISATSTLGILSEGQHYGGIYTGETAGEVIRDICGSVPVVIKSNLLDFKLYGTICPKCCLSLGRRSRATWTAYLEYKTCGTTWWARWARSVCIRRAK